MGRRRNIEQKEERDLNEKIDTLAVVLKMKSGKIYQVALDKNKIDKVRYFLSLLFDDGVVRVLDNELSGLKLLDKKK
jgi:hypothetical protein